MKCIIRYLRPFYSIMALGLFIKVLATMVELALPYILRHILDNVVPQASVEKIVLWGVLMIVCAALAMVGSVTANRMASKVARNAARAIRHDLCDKTMHLTARQTDRFTIPSLESRLTSDTYHVHNFIERIQRLGVRAPILLVGGLILTATLDWKLTLVMVAVMPFLGISVYLISRQGVPLYTKVQGSQDRMIRVVREDAQGIRVIKALSKTEYEKRRFDGYNRDLSRTERRAGTIMAASNPTMNLFLNLGLTAVIFVGALLISGNSGTKPGVIIAFMQYFTLLSNALLGITRLFVMYTRSAASANRIAEVLETENDLPLASEKDHPFRREEGYLVFDHVNFSYNGTKNNLTDIHFSLPQGKTLGIIGATGSGKSTVISLLMRFYDVGSGSVRIGGRDVRTIPADELHAMFGIVMQNDFIYADTVRENIRFGRDLTDAQIKRAAEMAQASDFIEAFDDGYEHMLSSKGTNVSGGQKQRLLISRALAGDPKILILDDSSSALDYKTDANLRAAITEGMQNTTTVLVAQRISSIKHADLIIVLDEGEIIGMGTHDHLLNTCDVYREISQSQMGGAFVE